MGMFDDLDPDFMSSPGAALPLVAARVQAVRRRHQVIAASVVGTGLIVLLGSMALGSNGKPDRLTVSKKVTTTTKHTASSGAPLITAPTTAASTSTTVAATSTTATLPAIVTSTSRPTTTTAPRPAHLVVSFDRNRLVIKSGTSMTIEAMITNDGGQSGQFGYIPTCAPYSVWPDDQSFAHPIAWPVPSSFAPKCLAGAATVTIRPGSSAKVPVKIDTHVLVEEADHSFGGLVPVPPGDDTLVVSNQVGDRRAHGQLPVTITPPDSLPLTLTIPSELTTASGAQHGVDFTITNNLPFTVTYFDQGPCALGGEANCVETAPHSARDLRRPPFDKARVPLWRTRFVLGPHETRMATAAVDGVVDLDNSDSSGPDLPPDTYHFFWDGLKVKFTVTP
jgi:hypothetical protein